jgi:hypothetical protein
VLLMKVVGMEKPIADGNHSPFIVCTVSTDK